MVRFSAEMSPKFPRGRNFFAAACGVGRGPKRDAVVRPGDYLPSVPVLEFTNWFRPVPSEPAMQRKQGLVGTTRVEVVEVVRDEAQRVSGVVLRSERDDPDMVRPAVHVSLFSSFGVPYWWQGHWVYGVPQIS